MGDNADDTVATNSADNATEDDVTTPSAAEALKAAASSPTAEQPMNGHADEDAMVNGVNGVEHDEDEVDEDEAEQPETKQLLNGHGEPADEGRVSDMSGNDSEHLTEQDTTTAEEDESERDTVIEQEIAPTPKPKAAAVVPTPQGQTASDKAPETADPTEKQHLLEDSATNDDEEHKGDEQAAGNKGEDVNGDAVEPTDAATADNPEQTTVVPNDVDVEKAEDGVVAECRKDTTTTRVIRKREIILCCLGGITFLIGLIMIIVGLMVMQNKCDRSMKSDNADDDVDHKGMFDPSLGSEHMHSHGHNDVTYVVDNRTSDHINIAKHKAAYQSSTWKTDESVEYNASLAVDGVLSNRYKGNMCAQTDFQTQPYWYVDLESAHVVHRVTIVIPGDCCVGELHDFMVRVGDNEDTAQMAKCKHFMGTALKMQFDIVCDQPVIGRFVSIQLLGDDMRPKDRLTLCEVMVFSS